MLSLSVSQPSPVSQVPGNSNYPLYDPAYITQLIKPSSSHSRELTGVEFAFAFPFIAIPFVQSSPTAGPSWMTTSPPLIWHCDSAALVSTDHIFFAFLFLFMTTTLNKRPYTDAAPFTG